jgi:hypothetical protein
MQGDSGVVGMTNAALHVHAGVTPHWSPLPQLRLGVPGQNAVTLLLGETVWILRAYHDRLTAHAIAELSPMRFASIAPAQRLIRQNHFSTCISAHLHTCLGSSNFLFHTDMMLRKTTRFFIGFSGNKADHKIGKIRNFGSGINPPLL